VRQRGHDARPAWLAPEPLPPRERRLAAGLLVAAAAFITLGGWVWSERRDPLTRAFFLLCVSFGALLAPKPVMPGARRDGGVGRDDDGDHALPARAVRALLRDVSRVARAGAAARVDTRVLHDRHGAVRRRARPPMSRSASACRARPPRATRCRSPRRCGSRWACSPRSRCSSRRIRRRARRTRARRLRVALIGTLLGVLPFAGLIVLRNVSPGTMLPGERWAVGLTLLVPASFAGRRWCIACSTSASRCAARSPRSR
jgi:hypothetical protein